VDNIKEDFIECVVGCSMMMTRESQLSLVLLKIPGIKIMCRDRDDDAISCRDRNKL